MHFHTAALTAALTVALTAASSILASPVPEDINPSVLPGLVEDTLNITDLNFSWHTPTANDRYIMSTPGTYLSDEHGLPISTSTSTHSKRQAYQPGVYKTNSYRYGDGDPHQTPYFQQQTRSFRCTDGECSAEVSTSHSVSWSASANAAYGWISGGFTVQESYGTSESYTCYGDEEDENVCVWFSYGVTAYTVKAVNCYYYQGQASQCRDLGTRVLFSPNNCQRGQPYCVRSACRNENDGYYQRDNAPAGGPPC